MVDVDDEGVMSGGAEAETAPLVDVELDGAVAATAAAAAIAITSGSFCCCCCCCCERTNEKAADGGDGHIA